MEVINQTMKNIILNPDNFVKQYLDGESVYSISNRLGVSRAVINKNLLRNGISHRGQSEAGLINWGRMSSTKRSEQVSAAHAAVLGRKVSFEERCKSAKARENALVGISETEIKFSKLMEQSGISFKQQTAIGPYNCDFTIGKVAIEIFGGCWHWYGYHLSMVDKRFRYILNSGLHILVMSDYGGVPIGQDSLSYMVSYLDFLSRHPTMTREYRVIRGAGELIASGSVNDDKISIKPVFTRGRDSKGCYINVPR